MAQTPEGARLTELHRLLQVRLSSQSMAATRLLWSSLDPTNGAAAQEAWLRQQVALSGVFDGKSANLAADYVQKFRAAEGFPGGPIEGVGDFDPDWARESMSYNGSGKVAALMDSGLTAKEALARAAPNAMAAAQRLALDGGRRVVDKSTLANPKSGGWRRVPDGNPCSFCAMLVSRGDAYRSESSAGRGRHWHKRCGCSVEETFGDWQPTEREQQYVDSYTSAVKDLRAEDRQPTQTNVLEHMRLNGKFNDSPVPKVAPEAPKPVLESLEVRLARTKARMAEKAAADRAAAEKEPKVPTRAEKAAATRKANLAKLREANPAATRPSSKPVPTRPAKSIEPTLRKLKTPDDPIAAMEGANNPPGVAGGDLYKVNCQKTVAAYEMRRRGFDVKAAPGFGGMDMKKDGFYSWFRDSDGNVPVPTNLPDVSVFSRMSATKTRIKLLGPPGSRGSLVVNWTGGGSHIVSWEHMPNGEVSLFDPQLNRRVGNEGWYLKAIPKQVLRTDNLDLVAKTPFEASAGLKGAITAN